MLQVLTVVRPGETAPERFARTLEAALEGRRAQVRPRLQTDPVSLAARMEKPALSPLLLTAQGQIFLCGTHTIAPLSRLSIETFIRQRAES